MVTESRSCNITGLKSVTVYRIRVISENGVSDQDDRLGIEETRTIEILAETKEGCEYGYIKKSIDSLVIQVDNNMIMLAFDMELHNNYVIIARVYMLPRGEEGMQLL